MLSRTRRSCRDTMTTMSSCLVYFGTSEGQTAKIAGAVAEHLGGRGIAVEVVEAPGEVDPSRFDAIVIGDSIHIGHYHRKVLAFIREHGEALRSKRSAFFSVCLGASSKNDEDRQRARAAVDDMMDKTGWTPDAVAVFAGALQYSKYGLLTRFIMKKIAAAEGLATDTSRDYEYTDWGSVAEFSGAVADRLLGESADVGSEPAIG